MRARTRSLLPLTILLACCVGAFALDPSLDVSQYAHTAWKIRDGFAKGAIASIVQTPDGYLWLGTMFGLLRFDGIRAVPWEPPRNEHLPPGVVMSLLVSRDGTLWIGATGLASFKEGHLSHYPELAGRFIYALAQDREGTIWVGAGVPGRLCAIRSAVVHCYGDDGSFGRFVASIYEDKTGTLWIGEDNGLWRWKPSAPKFYSLTGDPDGVSAITEDIQGTLLLGWKDGIYKLADGKVERYSTAGAVHRFNAHRMLRDRNGGVWVGASRSDRGLLHLYPGREDAFSTGDGLSGEIVYAIFEDREGSIWLSTADGFDRFREFAAVTLTVKQGLSRALVGSVSTDKNGSVWLATFGGLNEWSSGHVKIPRTGSSNGSLNGNHPNSLFRDDRGRIWVSTIRELGYLENGRFTSIRGVAPGNVLSIVQDSFANLWAINESLGLIRISPKNDVRQILWKELGNNDYASVLADDRRRGGIWIGFSHGGISYFSDGHIRKSYTAVEGLGAGRVSDFQLDEDGALWISTEGGLSRFKNDGLATLNSKNGLPCDTVHWAIRDDDYSMWLYTACGLVKIARSELDGWAAAVDRGQDTTRAVQVTAFDSSDGVRSLSGPGHYHPQVAKTSDGKLWFLPWDGVSVIDPHHLPFNKIPPPVHIEKITADDTNIEVSNGIHLPTGVRHLDIDYTALSLVVPEKVRFRVKLEGEDKDWRELVNVRHVEYTNLPPKHYRFRVLACNNSGVWNEEGAALDFVIPPAWYQTNWFRGACIAAFLMMIWGIHELRVRQLATQFNMRLEERVAERTRIARDLHDTLLQSFQGLLLQFKAISYRLQPGEIKKSLDTAIGEASQAITEGRDTVQGLRASIVQERDLAEAIRAFGEELASSAINQSPAFEVVVEGRRKRKRPFLRDEIYRIAIEALRNAFRHAQADRIEVELQYGDKEFTLRVRDNGRGIDRDVLSSDGRTGHFGLHGMRERAKLSGGELAIWSEVDSGTEIELTIPASRAYTMPARGFSWFRRLSHKKTDVKEKVES